MRAPHVRLSLRELGLVVVTLALACFGRTPARGSAARRLADSMAPARDFWCSRSTSAIVFGEHA